MGSLSQYPYSTLCCRNVAETLLHIAMLPFVTGCITILLQHCGNIVVEYCNGHVCAMFREYCAHNTRGILRTYCGTILPEYCAHIAVEYCAHIAVQYSRNIAHTLGWNIAHIVLSAVLATFAQNTELRVTLLKSEHAEYSLRFHRQHRREYMWTWKICYINN